MSNDLRKDRQNTLCPCPLTCPFFSWNRNRLSLLDPLLESESLKLFDLVDFQQPDETMSHASVSLIITEHGDRTFTGTLRSRKRDRCRRSHQPVSSLKCILQAIATCYVKRSSCSAANRVYGPDTWALIHQLMSF